LKLVVAEGKAASRVFRQLLQHLREMREAFALGLARIFVLSTVTRPKFLMLLAFDRVKGVHSTPYTILLNV
jgi:N-acetylglutamate synthase-like GNAT family acetyltransferase